MKNSLIIIILFTSLSVMAQEEETHPYFLFSPKGIAELHITMLNGKNINDIQHDDGNMNTGVFFRAEKMEAHVELKNSQTSTYSPSELYSGKILIKGRGNTSWHRPRRPYSIDLVTGDGEDNPAPLLGMGNDDEWALITFWEDRSLMRIPLALWLGRQMNAIDWCADFRYVELWVDNDYRGVYILTEKIKRGDSRINVKKLSDDAADQTEPRVTGGYILEVTPGGKMKREDENDTKIDIPGMENSDHWYVFKYPKPKNLTPTQQNYIFQYLTDANNTLRSSNYKDPVDGYAKYFDVNSFIDWSIIHDLSKGVDNLFHASVFIQKDRNEKLRMTAPWDFDLSFGNVDRGSCYNEDELWIKKTHYFNRLWTDDNFYTKLEERFEDLMPLFDMIPYVLQENYKQLEQNGVIERDYNKYGREILETYKRDKQHEHDYVNIDTYKGHVRYFKDWLESRKAWLYYNLDEKASADKRCERLAKVAPTIRALEPEKLDNNKTAWTTLMPNNGKYSYHWFVDDEHKTLTDNERYQITGKGEYTVRIVDKQTGCESAMSRPVGWGVGDIYKSPFAIEPPEPPTAVEVIEPDEIIIFPNPANDMIYIGGVENEDIKVYIYNLAGGIVKQTNRSFVNVSDLNNGIYLLKLTTKTNTVVRKIIVVSE